MTAAAAACEALLEIGGADVGQHEQPGGEAGTLAHLLTHSVSQCQFMFQTLQQLVRMVLYLGCQGQRPVLGKPSGQPWVTLGSLKCKYN